MTNPRVSVLLPSKHSEALTRTLSNVAMTTRGSYEVILVVPPDTEVLPWDFPRHQVNSSAEGPIATQAVAIGYATGDYVLAMADDFLLMPGWDDEAVRQHDERSNVFPGPYVLGLRHEVVGSTFGCYYANFPFMDRKDALELGWYDATFHRGFGDCDLSMRAWARDGLCEFSQLRLLRSTPDDGRKGALVCDPEDAEEFYRRWAHKHPGYGCSMLDDFLRNHRVDAELQSCRTFYERASEDVQLRALEVPRLVHKYDDRNLVHLRGKLYSVPHHLGEVDLGNEANRGLLLELAQEGAPQ